MQLQVEELAVGTAMLVQMGARMTVVFRPNAGLLTSTLLKLKLNIPLVRLYLSLGALLRHLYVSELKRLSHKVQNTRQAAFDERIRWFQVKEGV